MRKSAFVLLVLGLTAACANAAVLTAAADGALRLTLRIDLATGLATLYNNSSEDLAVDGYEIWSAGNHLKISGSAATGWISLADVLNCNNHTGLPVGAARYALADACHAAFDQSADYPVSGMTDAGNNNYYLGEFTMVTKGEAVFRPGLAAGWSIGKPVALWRPNTPAGQAAILADLQATTTKHFSYHTPYIGEDKYWGVVEFVPEPATMALLAAGGVVLRRRRR